MSYIHRLKNCICIFAAALALLAQTAQAGDYFREKIIYRITTGGNAEYNDLGLFANNGKPSQLVTFRTHIGGLMDGFERIYGEPDAFLPLRIERDVNFLIRKERLIEEYFPETFSVSIKKWVNGKFAAEYRYSKKKPVQNAILLRSYLKSIKDLHVGWSTDILIPDHYTVTLTDIEEIEVPAGRFKAFHFKSDPRKFELWVSCDPDHVPVKLAVTGGYRTSLEMKARIVSK
ncbi:MAG: DUF3108 domain-containing protein [Candidatus Omnitrophica bacterium]|nr:DUF3108 domain-containing protein [Candidatus Omnitrophota bacterium]